MSQWSLDCVREFSLILHYPTENVMYTPHRAHYNYYTSYYYNMGDRWHADVWAPLLQILGQCFGIS